MPMLIRTVLSSCRVEILILDERAPGNLWSWKQSWQCQQVQQNDTFDVLITDPTRIAQQVATQVVKTSLQNVRRAEPMAPGDGVAVMLKQIPLVLQERLDHLGCTATPSATEYLQALQRLSLRRRFPDLPIFPPKP